MTNHLAIILAVTVFSTLGNLVIALLIAHRRAPNRVSIPGVIFWTLALNLSIPATFGITFAFPITGYCLAVYFAFTTIQGYLARRRQERLP